VIKGEIAKSKLNFQQALTGVDEALQHYGINLGESGCKSLEAHRESIRQELNNFDVDFYPWMIGGNNYGL